jgi:flagellar hook-basal body complex protein FliE
MATSSFAADAYNATQNIVNGMSGKKAKAPDIGAVAGQNAGEKSKFAGLVSDALNSLMSKGAEADQQMSAAAKGEANLVNVVTAVSQAETLIQAMSEIRNKAIAAYDEMLRMQV